MKYLLKILMVVASVVLGSVDLVLSPSPTITSSTPSSCGINKTITIIAASGTPPYRYSTDNGVSFTAPTTNTSYTSGVLTPGNYDVVVSDANGCSVTQAGVVIQPNLEYTVDLTKNLTCDSPSPADEATYEIDNVTGSGTYTYEITRNDSGANTVVVAAGTPLPATPFTFSTAIADDYTITITDTAETPNCTNTKTFTVAPAVVPAFTTSVTDATCDGASNGSISVSVTAGLTPLTYSIAPVAGTWDASSNSFTGVPAGTYTVTVAGANGCSTDVPNIVVGDNDPLTVNAPTAVQFGCTTGNDVNNATLSIRAEDTFGVSGGTTVYSSVKLYNDNGTPVNLADDIEITTVTVIGTTYEFSITDVTGGSYYLEVVDSASCMTLSGSTVIEAFDPIGDILITSPLKQIDCLTGEDIVVKTSTDIDNVSYEIISGPVTRAAQIVALGTGSANFTDLPTGTYEVTATHPDTGCVFTKEYIVGTAPSYTVIANNPQATCFGAAGGSIDVSFDSSTLYAGDYTYVVMDDNGTPGNVADDNDITVTTTADGIGVGNVTETIGGLLATPTGFNYYVSVTMTDTPFCTISTNEFTINEPTAILSVTGAVTKEVSCENDSDATITATGIAGFSGYTYQLELPLGTVVAGYDFATNGTNDVFTGLSAGNYTIRVRDANNCEGTSVVVPVANPSAVTAITTHIDNSCDTTINGSIEVTAGGGTGTYTYVLTNSGGTEVANTGLTTTTPYTFSNLPADTYTVSVTDSNGCIAPAPAAVVINEDLVFTLNEPKKLTCNAPTTSDVVIDIVSGSGSYTYVITRDDSGTNTVVEGGVGIALPSDPYTFNPTIADRYTVTVTDTGATPTCPVIRTIDIAPAVVPVFTTSVTDATCDGSSNGSISVSVTAGLTPLTYSIAPVVGIWDASSNSFINLPAGTYTVRITGANGCFSEQTETVNDNPVLTANAPTAVQFGCTTGNDVNNATLSIRAEDTFGVSGGTTVYSSVKLYNDNGTPVNLADDIEITTVTVTGTTYEFSITDVTGGSYYLEVVDSASCMTLSGSTVIEAFDPIGDILITSPLKQIDCLTGEDIVVKTSTDIDGVSYEIISGPVTRAAQIVALGTGSANFTDLPTGTYEVTATHPDTGCVFTKEYIVGTAPSYTVIANNPQATCFGAAGGSIDVSFDSSTLYAGNYTYVVMDDNGTPGNVADDNDITVTTTADGIGVGNVTETIGGLLATPTGFSYYVSVTMTDTPFCTISTNEFTINEPTAILSVTGAVTKEVSCENDSDATITATGIAGFSGYTYQLELPLGTVVAGYDFATNGTNDVFTGLSAGNYTIRVRDANNCEGTSVVVPVANPSAVTAITTHIDNSCDTTINGSIEVTAGGGTGTYTYVLTNSGGTEVANTGLTTTTPYTFSNLPADTYTVSVTDSNGCIAPAPAAVVINEDLVFTLNEPKKLTCNAPTTSDVVIDIVSGSGSYTYVITRDDSGTNTVVEGGVGIALPSDPYTFNPTIADRYTVTVTDTGATPTCPVIRTIDIAPAVVPVFTTSVTDATCDGSSNGSISVSVTAGLTPLTYSIAPVVGIWDASSNSFINLPAGTYTVRITGANGCFSEQTETVNDNPVLTANAPTAVQFGCTTGNDVNNATLSIRAEDTFGVSGGTTVYSSVKLYNDNGTPVNLADDIEITTVTVTGTTYEFSITDVTGGSYYLEVVDSASCMTLSGSTVIEAFDPIGDILITSPLKQIDCLTGEDIVVKTSTDIDGVSYEIISGPVTRAAQIVALGTGSANFTDLPTGTYEVTATHPDTDCVFTKEYIVGTAPSYTVIANNPQATCFGAAGGSIDVSFDSSTLYAGNYTYVVMDDNGTPGNVADDNDITVTTTADGIGVGNVTETIGGLLATPTGFSYYVSVTMTDTPFCTISTNEFTINEPTAILSVTGAVTKEVSCENDSDATITATGIAGFSGYTYQLELPLGTVVAGYDFATNGTNDVFTGLSAGNYTIRVRDANNCEGTSVVVPVANPSAVTAITTHIDNSCDTTINGSIEVTAGGGTGTYTYVLTNSGGTEVANTGLTTTTPYTFSNLPADTYTVSVTDSNGCIAPAPAAVVINEDLVFTLNEPKKLTCNAPTTSDVVIDIVSGSGSYTYVITRDDSGTNTVVEGGVGIALPSDPYTFNPTIADRYTVTVTDTGATPTCPVIRTIDIAPAVVPVFTTSVTDATCDGSSNGSISVSVTAGLTPLTYSIAPVVGIWDASSNSFINLPAGTYTVRITGANGCFSEQTETVNDNPVLTANAPTAVQFGCTTGNDVNNATLSIRAEDTFGVSGGTTVYSSVKLYNDNGTPVNLADDIEITTVTVTGTTYEFSITDVTGGSYYLEVVDSASCMTLSGSTVIEAFDPIGDILITSPLKQIDCLTGEDIVVKTSTDIDGVSYEIISGPVTRAAQIVALGTGSANFTDLPTGTYEVTATHPDTDCVFTKEYIVGTAPSYTVIANNPQATCFGAAGGSIDVSFDSSTLYAGNYIYVIMDDNGTPGNVADDNDITATTIADGTGVGNVTETIGGLLATPTGFSYYVSVTMTDTPFCTISTNQFTIGTPTAALALNGAVTYISCNTSTGEVILTGSNGFSGYEYQLINNATPGTPIQNFSTNPRITGLVAGSYTATVRDAGGCLATFNFDLNATTPMVADVNLVENQCEGEYTASIEITNVSGGQTQDTSVRSYTYILIYPDGSQVDQSSNIFENLPAGLNYQVRVVDSKYSCVTPNYIVDIIDPIKVAASVNITADITCAVSTGTVELAGAGGTGTYMFSDDGVTYIASNTFTSVSAGNHVFYVRDANNCVDDVAVSIDAYETLTPTLNVISGFVTCNGDNNGVLSADVTGGFGNYEYQLEESPSSTVVSPWQSSNTFTGLGIGDYHIRVRSTNRFNVVCTAVTSPATIAEPALLTVAETHTNVTCYGGNDGTITVLASGGNLTGYEYNISSDPAIKFVTNNVFSNLAAGSYIITVKDKLGCTEIIPVIITEPAEFTATLTSVAEQACINDVTPVITLDVQGGLQPYFISINNVELATPYNTNTVVLGAAEGIIGGEAYYITVRDSGANCNAPAPIRLTTGTPVDLALTVDFEYTCPTGNIIKAIVADQYKNNMSYTLYDGLGNPVATNNTGEFIDVAAGNGYYVSARLVGSTCSENSMSDPIDINNIQALTMTIDDSQKNKLIADVNFGLPPYNFTVDGVDYGEENEFLILQTKVYTITVRDARGCEVTLTVNGVYVSITILNLFTPDGDGINDYWYPLDVEPYHNIRVLIFDRYARKITSYQGFVQGWDGTYDGKPLPAGDYWYTIYYNELSGEEKKLMGHFTLYR
ncbi:T9SS type B sorting domain-containing protein [Tenacibaculum retecalamus]|uniref:T9SS type B sorting domain-containing protein n=1 Tax=Tenacibaculum retecalamus TaxID=3018315 RepID=UPI0023D92F96|nr:T9SS type B sorting domain-containing protein [Tenacibaculum retecalamus]WBX70256.1 T9SS type B sorting domain-containing protein [Tenacibaculum retecalamus]